MDASVARKPVQLLPPASAPSGDAGDRRRARLLFLGLIGVYAIALAALVMLGLFGFLWKTVLFPALFAIAYLAGRFRAFARDWAVYIAAVAFFDSSRGLVYGLVQHFELPVHMRYVIRAEHALFGDPIPTIALQRWLFASGRVGWLERALVVIHASHFLLFLCMGFLVWLVRGHAFARFKFAMTLTMFLGIAGYLLIPTVPPWMAANRFFVLPPIVQITKEVYNASVPNLAASFDLNPIAAMPSLHTAFPTLLTLVCFEHFGRRGLLMLLYLLAVMFGIVYMGEHYVVDVMAGFALALVCYFIAYRSRFAPPLLPAGAHQRALREQRPFALGPRLALSALLIGLSQAAGVGAQAMHGDGLPSAQFIAGELDGHGPMAAYYSGLRAYRDREFARAQALLQQAQPELPGATQQREARLLLGESAYHNRDWPVVARALGGLPGLTPEQMVMLAETRFALGQHDLGRQLLQLLRADPPRDGALRARSAQLEQRWAR